MVLEGVSVSWELAFTLLDKLDPKRQLAMPSLGISIHPS